MALSSRLTLLQWLSVVLRPGDSTRSILPFIPRPLKWLFLTILLLNHRGLPLAWHFRVFRPELYRRVYHAICRMIESPSQHVARFTRLSRVGIDPFKSETVFKTRATPEACDLNIHLSNSSYAMTYDMVRLRYVVENFPLLTQDGGWIALGATHYVFTREIPLNSPYEIRLSVGAWDNKWMYMVARYVTYPSETKTKAKTISNLPTTHSPRPIVVNGPSSSLAPPSAVTPFGSASPSPSHSPAPTIPSLGMPLPPGAVLHCTAVSRLCCKIGRITIPPAITITTAGFAISPSRFAEIQSWRFSDHGKRIKEFYAGGWRDVPKGERWWEDALSGEIEERRVEGLRNLAATIGIPVFTPEASAISNKST